MPTDFETFESYPRGRLSLRWGRRQLLSALTSEVRALFEVRRQGALRPLADLGEMPDELLELMTPRLAEGSRIEVKDDSVWGVPPLSTYPLRLFSADSLAAVVLARVDGQTPLGVIAGRAADERGVGRTRAFACARGVFLYLVSLGVCVPR